MTTLLTIAQRGALELFSEDVVPVGDLGRALDALDGAIGPLTRRGARWLLAQDARLRDEAPPPTTLTAREQALRDWCDAKDDECRALSDTERRRSPYDGNADLYRGRANAFAEVREYLDASVAPAVSA